VREGSWLLAGLQQVAVPQPEQSLSWINKVAMAGCAQLRQLADDLLQRSGLD